MERGHSAGTQRGGPVPTIVVGPKDYGDPCHTEGNGKDTPCGEPGLVLSKVGLRSASPVPSCVSLKSDRSRLEPPNLAGEDTPQNTLRSPSPVPSCVSLKSDRSRLEPPNLAGDTPCHNIRSGSPVPSCVSLKSDRSRLEPPNLAGEDTPCHNIRPATPVPSCVSLKSDRSRLEPPNLAGEDTPCHNIRSASPVPSCVSLKSDCSRLEPPSLAGEDTPQNTLSGKSDAPSMGQSHVSLVQSQCLLTESQCGLCDQVLACPVSSLTCGHRFCEECISRHLNQAGAGTGRDCPGCGRDALRQVMRAHKVSLKRRFERIREGHGCPETSTLLERVYTQLHITEGESEARVNKEHEVRQVEATLRMEAIGTGADTPINCNDIFKPLEGRDGHIKTVLTKGIAGIGKTVSVQKFTLDWAQGLSNQDLDFLFVLPLRELNLVKGDHSLHRLLLKFHPELKGIKDLMQYETCQLVFIFDGLDESQLELNFRDTHLVSDIEQTSSVAAVITSLIRSSLLPMARVWITSRPAAADQIPAEYVQRVTEVRGFTDPQKDEYFQKRIADPNKASQILSHLRSSKSLHIMCHIPVFCWISATVLQRVLEHSDAAAIPRTLTEMFIHFLIIQTITSDMKFAKGQDSTGEQGKVLESNRDIVLKLSKLAFEHLEKGSLLFYEEDLRSCGIAVQDAAVYCGMCTEIFRQESLFGQAKVYSFVHVTIQEFLSALFIFQSYIVKDRDALRSFLPENSPISSQPRGLFKGKSVTQAYDPDLHVLLKGAITRSLQSKNGHLDLFLRFLLGIALETNQKLLQSLLTNQRQPQGLLPNHRVLGIGLRTNQAEGQSQGLLPRTENSTRAITKTISYIKDINEADISPERYINLFHCLLEMNDRSVHEKIQRYLQSGREKRKALRPSQCSALACVLLMSEETMEQLEPRAFNTSEEGCRRLLPAIRCCRRALLADCNLSEQSMEVVLSAVAVGSSSLRELDLSGNPLTEPSLLLLASQLSSAPCRLDTLKMSGCGLTECSCESLAPVLSSPSSCLRVLDLSNNQLCDAGAMQLSTQLQSPNCQLQILRLSSCRISEAGSAFLCSVVSQDSRLKELDLRHNGVGQPAANLLLSALLDPHSKLQAIGINGVVDLWLESGPGRYSCELTLDENTANAHLAFSEGRSQVSFLEEPQLYSERPERFAFWPQVLCRESLSHRSYWELWWTGHVDVGVAYKTIKRKQEDSKCVLGQNDQSWSLECHDDSSSSSSSGSSSGGNDGAKHGHRYCAWRNGKRVEVQPSGLEEGTGHVATPSPSSSSRRRVGVYLDWPGGNLSFYCVSTDAIQHLHTYRATFTEPLFAGFMVWPKASVTLCKIRRRGHEPFTTAGGPPEPGAPTTHTT